MNTKIKFTYKDVPYVLEYDRDIIIRLENAGFQIQEFLSAPMTNIKLAFKGAFLKNHRKTSDKLIDEIYSHMKNKDELVNKLVEMINETYETLFDENEDDEGNIEWGTEDLK